MPVPNFPIRASKKEFSGGLCVRAPPGAMILTRR